ncbi:hypothetical protein [Stenotrophomonas sp. PD6]|uniref:hypothetical protein n=1 Tax=Stenotrophomonas sp. PD6 TaxID=3368612 RepID=UPI003B9EEB03
MNTNEEWLSDRPAGTTSNVLAIRVPAKRGAPDRHADQTQFVLSTDNLRRFNAALGASLEDNAAICRLLSYKAPWDR